MRNYILRRILFFIPALLILALGSFLLLHYAPGSPADALLNEQSVSGNSSINPEASQQLRREIEHQLGLDLPVFYFSITRASETESSFAYNLPRVQFHGKNQFHRWLFGGENNNGVLHGDFGSSYVSHLPVLSLIRGRIGWSLFFTILSVLLAYLFSIPLAIKMASKPDSSFSKKFSVLLQIAYSLPSFWIATLLLFLFSNPDVFSLFPASGVSPVGGFTNDTSFFQKIIQSLPYLILPTIAYTYASFTFLTGSLKNVLENILQSDYIRTARAKGLSEKKILRRHALRNALLPLITVFSHIFPAAIGGSVILETIFTIPGMGLTIFQSIGSLDYPVIIAVFLITGLITMTGYLISDILYALADPRISFTERR
ncbi:MAG: ABC transporter permease [Bacteroidia bacterium]